jgi:hypothetical protein
MSSEAAPDAPKTQKTKHVNPKKGQPVRYVKFYFHSISFFFFFLIFLIFLLSSDFINFSFLFLSYFLSLSISFFSLISFYLFSLFSLFFFQAFIPRLCMLASNVASETKTQISPFSVWKE